MRSSENHYHRVAAEKKLRLSRLLVITITIRCCDDHILCIGRNRTKTAEITNTSGLQREIHDLPEKQIQILSWELAGEGLWSLPRPRHKAPCSPHVPAPATAQFKDAKDTNYLTIWQYNHWITDHHHQASPLDSHSCAKVLPETSSVKSFDQKLITRICMIQSGKPETKERNMFLKGTWKVCRHMAGPSPRTLQACGTSPVVAILVLVTHMIANLNWCDVSSKYHKASLPLADARLNSRRSV